MKELKIYQRINNALRELFDAVLITLFLGGFIGVFAWVIHPLLGLFIGGCFAMLILFKLYDLLTIKEPRIIFSIKGIVIRNYELIAWNAITDISFFYQRDGCNSKIKELYFTYKNNKEEKKVSLNIEGLDHSENSVIFDLNYYSQQSIGKEWKFNKR